MTTTVDDRPFVHDATRSFEFNALEELAWLREQIKTKDAQLASVRQVLVTIKQWDVLNPEPNVDLLADSPWLKALVEGALSRLDAPPKE